MALLDFFWLDFPLLVSSDRPLLQRLESPVENRFQATSLQVPRSPHPCEGMAL